MPHDIFVSADVIREFSVCPKHRSHVTTMFENSVFTLKTTSNIFHRRREKFKNTKSIGHFGFVFEEYLGVEITRL